MYTDGAALQNGDENAQAGSGLWYGQNDPRNAAIRLPDTIEQTNNAGEAVAILEAVRRAPKNSLLRIRSDSQVIIDGLTKNLQTWEDKGWIGVMNKDVLIPTVALMRSREGHTILEKVKGHSGNIGNDGADALAGEGARKATSDDIDLRVPPNAPQVFGAKLAKMTQALLYKGILENKTPPIRRTALINLDMIRYAVEEACGMLPTDARIWRSFNSKDIPKNIRAFLWKATHGTYWIGHRWEQVPNSEHRALCSTCQSTETMQHILTECPNSGQEIVLRTARKLWEKTGLPWPNPTLGTQLGCGMIKFKDDEGKVHRARSRLYTKLISQAAHTIWKIRLEWVIDRESDPERKHSVAEIERKYIQAVNKNLRLDCLTSDSERYGSRATNGALVRATWKGLLQNEQELPPNWNTWRTGVLVGIGEGRPPGRNR